MQNNFFFWAMVLVLSARFELANRCDYRYRRVERWTLNLKKTKNQVDSALERHVYHIWTENIYSSTSKYEVPGTYDTWYARTKAWPSFHTWLKYGVCG